MSAFAPPSCRSDSSDTPMIYGASIPVDAPVFMLRHMTKNAAGTLQLFYRVGEPNLFVAVWCDAAILVSLRS